MSDFQNIVNFGADAYDAVNDPMMDRIDTINAKVDEKAGLTDDDRDFLNAQGRMEFYENQLHTIIEDYHAACRDVMAFAA